MKYIQLLLSFFRFIKTGVIQEYEIYLIKKKNPGVLIANGFRCSNFSKFSAGEGSVFGYDTIINCGGVEWSDYKGYFKCGIHCQFAPKTTIYAAGGIELGDYVLIGTNVNILSHNHTFGGTPYLFQKSSFKKIVLKDNVHVGPNVTIIGGTTIGENSIVAANAVVTKDIPDNVMVAGIPAKIIKQL